MKKDTKFGVRYGVPYFIARVMAISIFFLLANTGNLLAVTESFLHFDLSANETTLEQVFHELEKQSGYSIIYKSSEVNLKEVLSVDVREQPLETILNTVLKKQGLTYEIKDEHIIVYKAKVSNEVRAFVTQQSRKVSGTVKDVLGEPMIGVSVLEEGTQNGTVTDFNGNYVLELKNGKSVLVFSYIGYVSKKINVENLSVINTELEEDVQRLDDVVVVGYGTMRKKDLTGSVAQVSSGTLENQAARQVDQALTGQIAGVQVISKSGMPGESTMIRVRGVGSITAGSEPLYVVDGFPVDDIQTLNPSDIESIDVLKDASSTAIYGSRGSNGVVIINTKRGVTGKPTVSVDVSFGLSKVYDIPRMMNGLELAEYAYYSIRNRNIDQGYSVDDPDPTKWRTPLPTPQWNVLNGTNVVDCNMVDEILRVAAQQRYTIGVSGGSENIKYLVSAEYVDQEGVVRNSDYKRLSVRSNVDVRLSQKANLKLSLNPSFTNRNSSYESSSNEYGGYMSGSPVNRAQLWPSYFPARDENGEYFMFSHNDASQEWNPLAQVNEVLNNEKRSRISGSLNLDYKILDFLRFNVMLGGSVNNSTTMRFEPSLPVFSSGGDYDNDAFGKDESRMKLDWITEYTLHYNQSFKKHNIQGLVGFTAQASWNKNSNMESNRYPNNLIPSLSAVAGILTGGSVDINEWSLLSYLARLNYNYDGKYYVTASWRADGSSRFGSKNKYGYFPSVALAWRISQENFLKNLSFLDDLKLRLSYGSTGNNNIGGYNHIATIDYLRTVLGGAAVEGYAPDRIENPLLTWEVQKSVNLGLDISLFANRLALSLDTYWSKNTDLLLDVNIPGTTGFSSMTKNIGEVKNHGVDIQVKTVNVKNKGFTWSTDFNISTFRNEVVALGPTGDPIMGGSSHITKIGHPIGMFYGYLTDGVFVNQAEVDRGPIFGPGTSNSSRPGDIRFVDKSGPDGKPDGVINSLDQDIMGNPYPDFTYGMTNNISWKNLSLSVSLYGSYGNEILNLAGNGILNKRGNRVGQLATQLNYWKTEQEPGDGKTPRPNDSSTGGNRNLSQHFIDTGSFLRINNLRLNYTLPIEMTRKWFNTNSLQAQIYFNVTNLYTFTKNKTCFNPDVSNSLDARLPGVSYSDYPLPRTFVLGVNLKF